MKRIDIPKGKLNQCPSFDKVPWQYCEFCGEKHTTYSIQGIRTCEKHKEDMLLLICPLCGLNLAIHEGGFAGQRFWCVVHGGFHGNELRWDTRRDEHGRIKRYWTDGEINKRRQIAEALNDRYYGKVAKDI
ncbi:hypothetical protein J4419_04185 [Candidatus Woesearchaeota archaeon]|nr:hypothetical protein [Candidatus Woesearchaeota archaeon]